MSDSVQIQDQQDSDSVQIQDQQDSDSVQTQDEEDSESDSDIDPPSTFRDVKRMFSFDLAFLRADPGRLDAVRELRTFRLCLHCIAYRISICGYFIYFNISAMKHYPELARLGYVLPFDEDDISHMDKWISDDQEEKAELTGLLDQARLLGLGQDVDNVTQACKLNLDIRRLVSLSSDEGEAGRWDQVLRRIVESVHLLDQRHEAWPSWPDLDLSRHQIMDPVRVYDVMDSGYNDAEWLILVHLPHVSESFLPPHAADVIKHVKFHSKYLDHELSMMSSFIAERSGRRFIQTVGRLMTEDDEEFCERSIEIYDDFNPPLSVHELGLRLYRLCWRLEDGNLADTAMKARFMDNPDKQQVMELLDRLLIKLRDNSSQSSNRIILSTEYPDYVTGEYQLPQLIEKVGETLPDEPWLDEAFKHRSENVATLQETSLSSVSSVDRRTTTTLKANQEVAQLFTGKDSIPDIDIYNMLLSYNDVAPAENQERETNIVAGVPYHCSVVTYHPAWNEWSVTSDMCRISGPLAVEQEGGTCVRFMGDCGTYLKKDAFVFKIRKSPSEHALLDYTADVRTKTTAAWYVNRFCDLTQDKFGVLKMRHSDLVIVYQDSNRDIILELMTREMMHRPGGSYIKFDKYMNDTEWKNENGNTDLPEAFTHFTHHNSGGTLMVRDLHGRVGWNPANDNIIYTLDDPTIHCPGGEHRFGWNNRTECGIHMFYQKIHPTCNHICESLNLVRPQSEQDHIRHDQNS